MSYFMIIAANECEMVLCIQKWRMNWQTLLMYMFLAVLLAVAFIDINTMKIPNYLIVAVGIMGVLAIPFFPEIDLIQRGIGMLCVSFPMFIITLLVPGGFGGGDIKLMAVCGLFLGYRMSVAAFAVAILTAGVHCMLMLATGKMGRKSRFAFGPFLCLGMAGVVIFMGI